MGGEDRKSQHPAPNLEENRGVEERATASGVLVLSRKEFSDTGALWPENRAVCVCPATYKEVKVK